MPGRDPIAEFLDRLTLALFFVRLLREGQDTRRQVEIYGSRVLPAKVRAVEAYNRQFDGGAATAFQLWQAQRDLNDARRRSLELAVTLADTRAKLTTLVGQPQF